MIRAKVFKLYKNNLGDNNSSTEAATATANTTQDKVSEMNAKNYFSLYEMCKLKV